VGSAVAGSSVGVIPVVVVAQKEEMAEQADRGLVLSPSSGLALLSRPLSSSSATRFQIFSACGAAPVLPFWAGMRRRRQKAEQAASRSGTTAPLPSRGGAGDLLFSRCWIYFLLLIA
jgi:hypothetical protein